METLPSFIKEQSLGVLCTSDENCNPSGATVFFVEKDQKLYIMTHEKSLKVQHIKNNPNVCFVIADPIHYHQAQLYATAKIAENPGDYLPLVEEVIKKYSERTEDFIPYVHIKNEGDAPVILELTLKQNRSYQPDEGLVDKKL
ncbi:MAG: pyridoxamine 5'-phosphate oxidase family protein [Candidatus Saccharibacteria bacterium]